MMKAQVALAPCVSAIAILAVMTLGVPLAHGAGVDPGVIGQWRFDEPDGQLALDDGTHGLHGQLGSSGGADGADPARIAGLRGGALHFDGDSFVRLPDAPLLAAQRLTVEAVVRADEAPGRYRYVMSRGSRGCFSGSYGLYTAEAGGIAFYVFDGERYFVSSTARISDIWDGDWHSVTGVFDGAAVRVFIDGEQVGAPLLTPPGTTIGYDQPREDTYFGTYVGTCTLPFVGDLDSLRILSKGRTAQEVAAAAGVPAATVRDPLPAAGAPKVLVPQAALLPKSSCVVSASRKTVTVRKRSVITVRVTDRGRPLHRVRVAVRRAGSTKILASARTNSKGRARIGLTVRRIGRLRGSVSGRPTCSPAYIRVARGR